jgi:hypothetical protein
MPGCLQLGHNIFLPRIFNPLFTAKSNRIRIIDLKDDTSETHSQYEMTGMSITECAQEYLVPRRLN